VAVYINKEGQRVLSLSDEEFSELQWEEKILLELEHDGFGWTIQQTSCNIGKATQSENKRD
jgi:hypothetical protein